MTATLQREHWNGQPTYWAISSALAKRAATRRSARSAKLWTHALGWEVRLEINGELQGSEVFRSQDNVLTAGHGRQGMTVTRGASRLFESSV